MLCSKGHWPALLGIGSFFGALALILRHYLTAGSQDMRDGIEGVVAGIGIGLSLVAILAAIRQRSAR